MGGSYRSSSSSSSYSRSSSYRSSNSYSSSSSRSSNSTSSSGYTNSEPEPTSYFTSTNQEIFIHFNADGSVHVKEKFIVQKNTAQVGIVRKKFSDLFDWKVENLKVTPSNYWGFELPHQININWSKGDNDKDIPIELEYDIKDGIHFLGNFPLVSWSIARNSKDSSDLKFVVTWDHQIAWKRMELKQKRYDQEISDYVLDDLDSEKIDFGLKVNGNSFHPDYREIIVTAFLDESTPLYQTGNNNSDKKNLYHIRQTSKLFQDTSIDHFGFLLVPTENKLPDRKFTINFNHSYFFDRSQNDFLAFLSPDYQFVYNFQDGLTSSFWTLHYASIEQTPEKRIENNKEFYSYKIGYTKLGEHKVIERNKKQYVQIIPFLINYPDHVLGSISLELEFPEYADLNQTEVKMYISDCDYCSEITPVLNLPVEIGKDKNRILLNWDNPLPPKYFPVIQIETKPEYFSRSYIGTYFAALRALLLSPGSGTNTGYLFFTSLLILIACFIIYLPIRKWKKHYLNKKTLDQLVRTIQISDPSFDLCLFLEKSKFIAEKIVSEWCSGDMNAARHFISAGVFQRFQIQLKLLKEVDQIKNIMKDFQVLQQEPLSITNYNDYQTVHLKLTCSARDLSLPKDSTAEQIEIGLKATSIGTYEEVYSFSRKIGAKTTGKDLIHNQCPACGAESPYSHSTNKCQYCGSIFNSGEADWVLSEITQMIEWNPNRFKSEESFANKHTKIPTSIQIIEDRASAVLWKWIYAKTKGNPDLIKRETISQSLLQNTKNKESFFIPVVGSAEINEIEKVGNEYVSEIYIHWSAARSAKALAEYRRTSIKLRLRENRDTKLGFSEVSCKNCGGPFPEVDATKCSFCSEPIPSLISDWLIESIH